MNTINLVQKYTENLIQIVRFRGMVALVHPGPLANATWGDLDRAHAYDEACRPM
jgi:hypothetical protein